MDRRYRFVGGPQDGNEIPVGEPVSLGVEIAVPVLGQERTAVYLFGEDGRFHFTRYGPAAMTGGELDDEDKQKLTGIMQRLASTLTDLDAFCASHGGYPGQTQVGSWVLTKTVGVK